MLLNKHSRQLTLLVTRVLVILSLCNNITRKLDTSVLSLIYLTQQNLGVGFPRNKLMQI